MKRFIEDLNALMPPDKQYVYLEMGDYFRGVDRIIKGKASAEDMDQYGFLVPIVTEKDAKKMRAGKLVSNETALKLVNAVLEEHKTAYGIIFDGFPRTPDQLEFLKLEQVSHRGIPIQIQLFLTIHVNEEIAVERIKDRAIKDKAAGKIVRSDDVDPDVLAVQKRITAAQQEHGGEQVPLQFEPGIRTIVEQVADHGVAGTDQHGNQCQPVHLTADEIGHRINQSRHFQQSLHSIPPGKGLRLRHIF